MLSVSQSKNSAEKHTGSVGSISSDMGNGCTGLCMNSTTVKFQKTIPSTTPMVTGQTTRSRTLCSCARLNTLGDTCVSQKERHMRAERLSSLRTRQKSGTDQRTEELGTVSTTSASRISCTRKSRSCAPNAARLLKLKMLGRTNFAVRTARQHSEEPLASITRRELAQLAEAFLRPIDTPASNIAQTNAAPKVRGVRAVKVTCLGKEDVYCLTVPDIGCFALPNGVIASNCDAAGYFIHKEYPIVRRITTSQEFRI